MGNDIMTTIELAGELGFRRQSGENSQDYLSRILVWAGVP